MYLLCGFWKFKVTLSLELAAKGKDEMCGKHHVPSSLLDFPEKCAEHSSLCKLTAYWIQTAMKSSNFKTPWKVGL